MITRLQGQLTRVLDDRLRLEVGGIEYELFVSEATRRAFADRAGQSVVLHTKHYLEAGAMQTFITPRLIGFETEAELEFFELFCTVDKIGVKKALKALTRPVREIAEAIRQDDVRYLSDLPGIGKASAEKIVAALRKKVVKFVLLRADGEPATTTSAAVDPVLKDAYDALLSVGHSPGEARLRLAQATAGGRTFATVEDVLLAIYQQQN